MNASRSPSSTSRVGGLDAGAQVLDHLVGLQDIGTDLVAPADIGFSSVALAAPRASAALPRKAGRAASSRPRAVLVLRALGLAGHGDAGRRWVIRTAESVVLTCWPPAPTHDRYRCAVRLVDLDIDLVVDHRIGPDRGKGSVTAGVAVIGGDAHQAVDAGFGLQLAIGVVALDQEGRGLDFRLFAVMLFEHLDLQALALAQRVYMRSSMEAQSWLSVHRPRR